MSLRRIVAAAAIVSLGACTSVTNVYDRWFGSVPTTKPAPLVPIKPTAQARVVWRGSVGPAERSVFFPAVSGNVVYAAGAAGQITGFEVQSGKVITRINTGQRL